MNYISVEEFLKQSEKVQGVLKEWWQPQRLELIHDNEIDNVITYIVGNSINYRGRGGDTNSDKYNVTPLLQMHQLIQFIEDRVKTKITIDLMAYELEDEYQISYLNINNILADNIKHDKLGNNLLQALWQVTIEIAEEN